MQLECDSRVTTAWCWRSLPLSLKVATLINVRATEHLPRIPLASSNPEATAFWSTWPGTCKCTAQKQSSTGHSALAGGGGPGRGHGRITRMPPGAQDPKPAPARRGCHTLGSQFPALREKYSTWLCFMSQFMLFHPTAASCLPAASTAWAGGDSGRALSVSVEMSMLSTQHSALALCITPTAESKDSQWS